MKSFISLIMLATSMCFVGVAVAVPLSVDHDIGVEKIENQVNCFDVAGFVEVTAYESCVVDEVVLPYAAPTTGLAVVSLSTDLKPKTRPWNRQRKLLKYKELRPYTSARIISTIRKL